MSKKIEYHQGRFGAIVKYILGMVKKDPSLVDDFEKVKSFLFLAVPELNDKSKCANCSASMKEYIYSFDAPDCQLLTAMAKAVRDGMKNRNLTFTQANQVRIPELAVAHYVKCRTTKCSKLGLVVELRSSNKKRVPGTWVITRRGWDALRGTPVPGKVRVWRKKIEERFEHMVTMNQIIDNYRASKRVKRYGDIDAHNSTEWYEFGFHEGKIFP